MKKNLIYTGTLLMAMAVATGCSNEDGLEQVTNQTTVKAVIDNGTNSRTYVDGTSVKWSAGDAFTVWNGETKQGNMVLSDGQGTTSGTFAGDVALGDGYIALFPAVSDEPETKTFTFPTSYESNETDAPMVGVYTSGAFTFSHLAAMVRVTITNAPANELTLTLASTNNEILTGESTLTESNGTYTLSAPSTGETSVSATATASNSTAVFEIPVPAQNYQNGLNVTLKSGTTTILCKTTDTFNAEAGQLYKLEAKLATAGGNTGIVGQEVTTSEALSTAAAVENNTIVVNATEALTLPTNIAKGVTIAGAGENPTIAVSSETTLDEGVTLQGLTISATSEASLGSGKGAVKVTGSNVTIDNCTFTVGAAQYDIVLSGANPTISNCTFSTEYSTSGVAKRSLWIAGASGTVTIDNCTFSNNGYTFNTGTGNSNVTLDVKSSTLNGWTSYDNGVTSATFTNCTFGTSTYNHVRPYANTTFSQCNFANGFTIDHPSAQYTAFTTALTHTFTSCKYNENDLTSTSELVTGNQYLTIVIGNTTYEWNNNTWTEKTTNDEQ